MRTGRNVSIYLDDKLDADMEAYIDACEAAGLGRPSRSAIISLAVRRYLEKEKDGAER